MSRCFMDHVGANALVGPCNPAAFIGAGVPDGPQCLPLRGEGGPLAVDEVASFSEGGIRLTARGWDSTSAAAEATSGCKAPPAPCQAPSGSNPTEIFQIQTATPKEMAVCIWKIYRVLIENRKGVQTDAPPML